MPKGFLLSFGFTNESDNHCSAAQVYGEHNRSNRSQILLTSVLTKTRKQPP